MNKYKCVNHGICHGYSAHPGDLCADCKRGIKSEGYRQDWRAVGWTRHEERDQMTGKKHRKDGTE